MQAGPVSHRNVALLVVDDGAQLDAWLERPEIRALVWKRLDANNALVDPDRVALVVRRLRESGVSARYSLDTPHPSKQAGE
jgi:hypothetical protein